MFRARFTPRCKLYRRNARNVVGRIGKKKDKKKNETLYTTVKRNKPHENNWFAVKKKNVRMYTERDASRLPVERNFIGRKKN